MPKTSNLARIGVLLGLCASLAPSTPANASTPGMNGDLVIQAGDTGDIFTLSPDGSNLLQLTSSTWEAHRAPAWSPDGQVIAYLLYRLGGCELRTMLPNGEDVGAIATIDDCGGGGFDPSIAWSPDGSDLAFIPNGDLWTVHVDSSGLKNVSVGVWPYEHYDFVDVAWSPTGEHLAASVWREGLFVFDLTSAGIEDWELIGCTGSRTCGGLSWSPDGTFLAYAEDTIKWVDPERMAVGSAPEPLQNESFHEPAWAPDGSGIAFIKRDYWDLSFELRFIRPSFPFVHDFVAFLPEYAEQLDWQAVKPEPVGLVDPNTGRWYLRTSTGAVQTFYYGNPGDVPFMGDWDCDTVATPGLFRTSDAFAYLRNSNTQGIADIRFFFGNPSDVPLAGDFNGDGCDTLSIYRPSEARFYIINKLGEDEGGLGAAEYSFLFGNPGDKPVVGDWDGDGIDEIGLHRETTGFFYYRNTLSTGIADGQFYFGDPGDRFVAGDWGVVDGVETPAMYRPSNSTFYFRHTLTQGNADSQFIWTGAEPDWLPVSGDFTLD